MCTVCGCGDETGTHDHSHDHTAAPHNHHFGQGAAGVSVAGYSQDRLIQIEQNILSKNDDYAEGNRKWLAEHGLLALNMVSSPGAGKTTLLVETLQTLKNEIPLGVIEGDQETANDADRIRETGVPAIQINTGRGCHLDAHMIGHALQDLHVDRGGAVLIENVGNLVCPAAFDLGEASKVVILSVTEGEDKPIKYPDMFAAADLMILSKVDLLPYVDFDVTKAEEYARRVNPDLEFMRLSAKTGEGLQKWQDWIITRAKEAASRPVSPPSRDGSHAHA
ncbi:MAG: hydrogenase nickel incorporation protein HypB [Rhodospirillales bacterium]|jgi:hydrogenase nickel incorporation protein HypB|nr:hydrogenase nickel incorporation protein HypB [Rhodospirillales bacterium]MBT4039825.1 hydrogenase nickel incorporation protein HypB [Rhodospirillales bacterium]MBT4625971.1 hydrogenase nickel incorporation protein HypB [Rhodospirillales bacterium]MBT5350585.1 hydrogenase nickel incorporation protein HypB [Rhodospirillales bacterium]MBT5520313.1 hydrogenase nickel incorporation protein HypB [Rhodospirillales bacterium]